MKHTELTLDQVERILEAMGKNGTEKVVIKVDELNGIVADYTNAVVLTDIMDFSWLNKETAVDPNFFKTVCVHYHMNYTAEDGSDREFVYGGCYARHSVDGKDVMIDIITYLRSMLYCWFSFDWDRFIDLEKEANANGKTLDLKEIASLMHTTVCCRMKEWKDLTEEEREAFVREFYQIWKEECEFPIDLNLGDNAWGEPWYWDEGYYAMTPREWWETNKEEIVLERSADEAELEAEWNRPEQAW